MKIQKNILIVTSQSPYPTYHGGAFDVFEKLKGIKSLGFSIDLVITTKFEVEKEHQVYMKQYVDNLFIVNRENRVVDLLKRKPIQYTSRTKLKNIEFKKKYEFLLLESEFLSSILDNKTLMYDKLLFRVHNNETYYFRQLANSSTNIFKKVYYWLDSIKIKKVTDNLLEKADRVWYISKKELEESKYSRKSIFLPPPINETFIKNVSNNHTILFVGSLFMENNVQGLDWFLKEVHPYIIEKYPNYKFIIAGSTGEESEKRLFQKYSNFSKTQIFLNQKSLDKFYEQSNIFINPMFYGSGVKLKSINSLVKGLLLLSTNVGVEGIGLKENEMYFKANSKKEFLSAVDHIFNMNAEERESIVKNSQDYLESIHYLKVLKEELDEK